MGSRESKDMKLKLLFLVVLVISFCFGGVASTANKRDELHIRGSAESSTHECKGRNVHISGSMNKITLNGVCPTVHVSGSGNEVLIDTVGTIKVSGASNKVFWQKAANGKKPNISNPGINNTIAKAK